MAVQRSYQVISGYFIQDSHDPSVLPAIPPRFGLLDESPNRWRNLQAVLQNLNANAEPGTSYKLFFLGRHGQGFHNVAEAKYGTEAWEDHWAKLNTDGEIEWGPDPELTQLGLSQAAHAHEAWKEELKFAIPFPERVYCSPLTRALRTHEITFQGIIPEADKISRRPIVVELCREQNGVHTCDKRRSRTYIRNTFPFYEMEDGLSEEDELWLPDVRESPGEVVHRARKVLDAVFEADKDRTVIAIITHCGFISAFCVALGATFMADIPTGGVLPVLVKSSVQEPLN